MHVDRYPPAARVFQTLIIAGLNAKYQQCFQKEPEFSALLPFAFFKRIQIQHGWCSWKGLCSPSGCVHHVCTIPALSVLLSEEVTRKNRCYSWHEHIKDISLTLLDRPSQGRRAFGALCLFPCVQQWLLKIQDIGLGSSGALRLLLCFYSLPSLCI